MNTGTDILYVEDAVVFDDRVDGIQIHGELLSEDFDDVCWEPQIDDTPAVDPNNDKFGYYK